MSAGCSLHAPRDDRSPSLSPIPSPVMPFVKLLPPTRSRCGVPPVGSRSTREQEFVKDQLASAATEELRLQKSATEAFAKDFLIKVGVEDGPEGRRSWSVLSRLLARGCGSVEGLDWVGCCIHGVWRIDKMMPRGRCIGMRLLRAPRPPYSRGGVLGGHGVRPGFADVGRFL